MEFSRGEVMMMMMDVTVRDFIRAYRYVLGVQSLSTCESYGEP
jgi:hypothetical protein